MIYSRYIELKEKGFAEVIQEEEKTVLTWKNFDGKTGVFTHQSKDRIHKDRLQSERDMASNEIERLENEIKGIDAVLLDIEKIEMEVMTLPEK